jgi:hypothetical protein
MREEANMLWTIAMAMVVLWSIGLISAYTMGGYIHILLLFAVVLVLFIMAEGRRA